MAFTMGGMLIYKQFASGEQFAVMRVEGEQVHPGNGQETAVPVVRGTCQDLSGHDFPRRVLDSQHEVRFLWQGYTQYVFAMRRVGSEADGVVSVVSVVFVVLVVLVVLVVSIFIVFVVIIVAFVVLLCLVAVGCLVVCSQE